MRALRYAFEEAFTSLWRGRQAGMLSTATIALALFVLGGFLVGQVMKAAAGKANPKRVNELLKRALEA